jgi:hypothetical protein
MENRLLRLTPELREWAQRLDAEEKIAAGRQIASLAHVSS